MKKFLFIVILIICVVIIIRSQDDDNTRSDSGYLQEIAWGEKKTAFNKYHEWIKALQVYFPSYNLFLDGENNYVPVVEGSVSQVISEAVSLAVRQPQIEMLDDSVISLSITMDKLVELMNEISDYSLKVKDTGPAKGQINRYKKEFELVVNEFTSLSNQFKEEFKVVKDKKMKEDQQKYLAEGRFIRRAQEDMSYEIEKFYELLIDHTNGSFRLREIKYNEVYKLYVTIINRISNYRELLDSEKQVEKEVLSDEKSKKAIEDVESVTEKLDYSMRQITNYIKQMQGKQLSPEEIGEAVQQESRLLQDYLLYSAQLLQAELNMNLNLRSYIVEE